MVFFNGDRLNVKRVFVTTFISLGHELNFSWVCFKRIKDEDSPYHVQDCLGLKEANFAQEHKVLSSAKLQISNFSTIWKMLLMKMLNLAKYLELIRPNH